MQAFLAEGIDLANSTGNGFSTPDGIAEALSRRLKESPFAAVRHLRCDFHDGVLTLSGRVPTYYTKQIAISLACSSPGVDLIVDRVEVSRPILAIT